MENTKHLTLDSFFFFVPSSIYLYISCFIYPSIIGEILSFIFILHTLQFFRFNFQANYFADFIVGAPYDGDDHRGAVYVYHGAKNGVRKEPTQKIEARKVNADLKAFGFSLTGGKDIDKNQYPG